MSSEPPPVRDVYADAEAPEWATATTARPSLEMSIRDRVQQSHAVPLELYHVYASRNQVLIVAELPGVKASEIFFAVDPGLLTICSDTRPGEDEHANGSLWQVCRDMRKGKFSYTVGLPRGLAVDDWTATVEDGEFRLRIPRARPGREPARHAALHG